MEVLNLMQGDEQMVELVRERGYWFRPPVESWIHGVFHISILWLLIPQFLDTIQQSTLTSFHRCRLADIVQVHFPNLRLVGKAIFMGGGVDRNFTSRMSQPPSPSPTSSSAMPDDVEEDVPRKEVKKKSGRKERHKREASKPADIETM